MKKPNKNKKIKRYLYSIPQNICEEWMEIQTEQGKKFSQAIKEHMMSDLRKFYGNISKILHIEEES